MDAHLNGIVDQFKNRLNELVPGGCREKSLSITHLETAQMWAEAARGTQIVRLAELELKLYANPEAVGWRGYLQAPEGAERPIEAFIGLDGKIFVPGRNLDPDTAPPAGAAVTEAEPPKAHIIDLMEALKASLASHQPPRPE